MDTPTACVGEKKFVKIRWPKARVLMVLKVKRGIVCRPKIRKGYVRWKRMWYRCGAIVKMGV